MILSVYLINLLSVVGDAAVGKSALTQMFHSDSAHYPKNYVMVRSHHKTQHTSNPPGIT